MTERTGACAHTGLNDNVEGTFESIHITGKDWFQCMSGDPDAIFKAIQVGGRAFIFIRRRRSLVGGSSRLGGISTRRAPSAHPLLAPSVDHLLSQDSTESLSRKYSRLYKGLLESL